MRIESFPLWPGDRAPDPAQCAEATRGRVIAAHGADAVEDDEELGEIVRFAAELCAAPIALVSIVEKERQRFLARKGMELRETPRSDSFCAHAMLGTDIFEIEDATRDERFCTNALVTGAVHLRFYAGAPLVSSEGVPLGALCVIDDKPRPGGLSDLQRKGLRTLARAVMRRLTSERENISAAEAINEADRRLLAMAEHIPVYAWATDVQGNIEFANAAFYEYAGTRDVHKLGMGAMVHPDDVESVIADRSAGMASGAKWETRARVKRDDGAYRWMLVRVWPMRTEDGSPSKTWFGAAIDVDDLHRLSESRDLLARELSHRIKNIFAVIAGLIAVRAHGKPEVADFAKDLADTVRSLGRAHDYVRPIGGRKGNSLHGLLDDLLAPYREAGHERIAITGEDAPIGPNSATPLALVFHELATNAAKYGALASPAGTIAIELGGDEEKITIGWHERGANVEHEGKGVEEGFGSRLLRMAVGGQLGGSFEREFTAAGLQAEMKFPREAIQR